MRIVKEIKGRSENAVFVEDRGVLWLIIRKTGRRREEKRERISAAEMEKWINLNRERKAKNA